MLPSLSENTAKTPYKTNEEYYEQNEQLFHQLYRSKIELKKIDKRLKEKKHQKKSPALLLQEKKEEYNTFINIRNEIVSSNMGLVRAEALRMHHSNNGDFDTYMQDGTFGLIHAAEIYDISRGTKFATCARWWIWNSMVRQYYDTGSTVKVHRKMSKFRQRLPENASHEEYYKVASKIGITKNHATHLLPYVAGLRSLDEFVREDSQCTLGETLSDQSSNPEELLASKEEIESCPRFIDEADLSKMQKAVLLELYGITDNTHLVKKSTQKRITKRRKRLLELSLNDAAEIMYKMGLTENRLCRERIRQIEKRAIEKIRDALPKDLCYLF